MPMFQGGDGDSKSLWLSWMKFHGHKVTTMWKIKVTKTGLHLCSEDQVDFNKRLENEPVEEGTCIHNIEGMGPI